MSHAIQALAEARAAFVAENEKAEAAHGAQSKLLVRKSECEATAATALNDFRAGKIDEATAALRQSVANADAKDLGALIAQGAAHLQALNQAVNAAKAHADTAEHAAKKEEWALAAVELDKQIAKLEATFLAAMSERYRLHIAINGNRGGQSTFGFYEPSRSMTELITRNLPPAV
jgi:predicted transglutaminase-like cysteine proteinase